MDVDLEQDTSKHPKRNNEIRGNMYIWWSVHSNSVWYSCHDFLQIVTLSGDSETMTSSDSVGVQYSLSGITYFENRGSFNLESFTSL